MIQSTRQYEFSMDSHDLSTCMCTRIHRAIKQAVRAVGAPQRAVKRATPSHKRATSSTPSRLASHAKRLRRAPTISSLLAVNYWNYRIMQAN